MSQHGENAGGELVELQFAEYQKPWLTVTDFRHEVRPRLDEQTGELVGLELWLHHPGWPVAVKLLLARLYAVELATGILAFVESYDEPDDGPTETGGGEPT